MLTIVKSSGDPKTIAIPESELVKLGLKDGDEMEILRNEHDEIVLRPAQGDRAKRVLNATREIISERKSALIELGKGHE